MNLSRWRWLLPSLFLLLAALWWLAPGSRIPHHPPAAKSQAPVFLPPAIPSPAPVLEGAKTAAGTSGAGRAKAAGAGTTATKRPATEPPVPTGVGDSADRYAQAEVVDERTIADAKHPAAQVRVRLVRTNFKYPLLRVEDHLEVNPLTGKQRIERQETMVADHVIVKLKEGFAEADLNAVIKPLGGKVRRKLPASGIYLVELPRPTIDTVPLALAGLAGPVLALAEPDYIAYASVLPNDSRFSELWGMHNTGQTGGTADADIDAPEAWDLATTRGSLSVKVGVIDTGIDATHPDLAANIWTNPNEIAGNGLDDDGNGYIDDTKGWDFVNNDNNPTDDNQHGTHCSGTIGGTGNNGAGVAGVCWNVSLIGLKFLDASGSGAISDATEATAYATAIGVNLTSNSWGGGGYSQAMKDAIDAANVAGILFVAAAGNATSNNDASPNYPSNYDSPNVIAVASTTSTDDISYFSSYGATTVDLAAPGSSILSSVPGGGYALLSGTSMATPHVAGACALLKSFKPALSHLAIKDLLIGSAEPKPALAGKCVSGGRLNIHQALLLSDDITVSQVSFVASGPSGGPYAPTSRTYTVTNNAPTAQNWTATKTQTWLTLTGTGGSLLPGATATVTATLNAQTATLPDGAYNDTITFANTTSGRSVTRAVTLNAGQRDYFTELFDSTANDTANQSFIFTPNGSVNFYRVGRETATAFPTDPTGGAPFAGGDDDFYQATFTGGATVALYGTSYSSAYMGTNGYVTFGTGDSSYSISTSTHFNRPRVTGLLSDLYPSSGQMTWKQTADRVAFTWQAVPLLGGGGSNSFQIEMFFDGRVRITMLGLTATGGLIGLSKGLGVPTDFVESDFSSYPPPNFLTVTLPARLAENAGTVTGTVQVTPVPTAPLIVNLISSQPGVLGVASSVTVPTGASSATFSLTPVNNSGLNGSRAVAVSVSATGYSSAGASTMVDDDETTTLSVTMPAAGTEGGTVAPGQVSIPTAAQTDVTVALSSDNTAEVQVPASVTILAGQMAATFAITIVNDNRIDGAVTTTIAAQVPGWIPGSASIVVADNELSTLAVTLPTTLREGDTGKTGTVAIPGTLTVALTVALSSNDTTELTVPATATIAAGQTSVTFPLTVVNDPDADGAQTATITATALGFTSGSATGSVADNDAHHFSISAIADPRIRNQSFAVTVTARDVNDAPITNYNSPVSFAATAGGGSLPVTPATVPFFTNGSWTGQVTVGGYASAATLVVSDATTHTGTSNSFAVTFGALHHFGWAAIASPQFRDAPFPVTISAQDSVNNTVTTFAGTAALSAYLAAAPTNFLPLTPTVTGNFVSGVWSGSIHLPYPAANLRLRADDGASHIGDSAQFGVNVPNAPPSGATTVVTLPAQVTEGSGPQTGIVRLSAASAADTVVALASGAPAKISVPASVTVPAGQTSADFTFTVGNDTFFDGNKIVFVTALAPGDLLASASTLVVDDEATTIALSLSGNNVTEGAAPLTATATLGAVPAAPITLGLAASPGGRLSIPVALTFAIGQSTQTFPVNIVDDAVINGTQSVTLTLGAPGWTDATATVTVQDNENTNLTLTVPASLQEGDGLKTGTVAISGSLATPLTVTLSSTDTSEITVLATVTIPAGQTSANFPITVVDDAELDGAQSVIITATAPGFTGASATRQVADNDVDHFSIAAIGSSQVRNSPISVVVTARDAAGGVITSFTGPVTLTATGSTGALVINPATLTGFVNGVKATFVQIDALATGVVLTVSGAGGRTGTSNPFDLVAGSVSGFAWDAVPSPQTMDTPFAVRVRAVDGLGNTVTGFNSAANLSIVAPKVDATIGTGGTQSHATLYTYYQDARSNSLYTAAELGGAGRLIGLAVNVVSMGSTAEVLTNFTIRLKHTMASGVTSGTWDNAGWTQVYRASPTISAPGWVTFNFTTPFDYDGTSNLLVDLSFDRAVSNSAYTYLLATYDSSSSGTLYGTSNSTSGDPLTWTTSPSAGSYPYYRTDVRFTRLLEAPIRPALSGNFSNGVWNGQVSVPFASTGVALRANAGILTGTSGTFDTVASLPAPSASSTVFAEDFESGVLNPAYWTITGTGGFRTINSNLNAAHGGNRHMTMDLNPSVGGSARNEATLAFNLTGRTGVILTFWAKEFSDDPDGPPASPFPATGADFDGVAISADGGVNWYEVQALRTLTGTYAQLTVNLDAAMASRGLTYGPNFKIRFNQYGSTSISFDGIAIDDILLTANPLTGPVLTLPMQATEGATGVTGTVAIAAASASDTTVALASSAPAIVAVPATATILAGQTSATFPITLPDDVLLLGDRTVYVTMTPAGLPPRATTMVVVDDETGTLALSLPTSAAEGATGVTGSISVSPVVSGPVVVNLVSSDTTELTVPASVTVQAGQTSATFPITVVNDTRLDGPQNVTITASVAGWAPATAVLQTIDNESRNLSLNGPYSVTEGGTTSGTIYISGAMTAPLVVSLTSANPAQLTVPATVTIPAGSTSVSFTATGVDDTLFDGTQSVLVTASAATFVNGTYTTTVYDNDVHHFAYSAIPTAQTVGQPFSLTVYAQDVNNASISYAGPAALSAAAGGSPLTMTPTITGTFSGAQWTGNVTITQPGTGAAITATAAGVGVARSSASFNVSGSATLGVSPASVTLALAQGAADTRTLTLANTGSQGLNWQINASTAPAWITPNLLSGHIAAAGSQNVTLGFAATGFLPGTYSYTLVITSNDVTRPSVSVPIQLTVLGGVPVVATAPTTGVTTVSATLRGSVNPNGLATTAQFEYGPTTSYGSTASVTLSPNNGTSAQAVSAAIGGLTPGAVYHYRLTATNSDGSVNGTNRTFTASVPVQRFTIAPIGGTQVRNSPIPVTVTALDATGSPILDFNGPVYLTAVGSTGALVVTPSTLTGFVKGVKTVLVQIDALATGVVLTANENNWHVGQSNPFDLVAGSVSGFAWDAVPSPQTADTPFAVRVRAVDGGGSTITSFNGAANLSATVPVAGATIGVGTTTTYPTLYAYYHDARSNSLYTAAELGGAGRLTALAFNVTSVRTGGEVLDNLTIRLKHTAATAPTAGTWDNTGWTQVYRASPTISATGWVTFNFTTPFDYNGTSNLLVDLSFDRAASNSSFLYVQGSSTNSYGTVYGVSNSTNGDPLTWTTTPSANGYYQRADARFSRLVEVSVRPTVGGSFVNGVWNGQVSVPFASTGVALRASAGALTGTSNTFDTVTPPPPPLGGTTVFAEDFESGLLNPVYWTITGTNYFRTLNTDLDGPHGGARHLRMDNSTYYNALSRNEATVSLNLTGRTGVVLSFWAKEFSDSPDGPPPSPFPATGADFDGVAISADGGVNWYEVQALRTLTGTYAQLTVNLDAAMASRGLTYGPGFKIRFNQFGYAYTPYAGIAIDDILITANPLTGPVLTLPTQATEGTTGTGTVTIAAASGTATTVALASSAPAIAAVPATATIPAGQTSATFPITLPDDVLLLGDRTVYVTMTPAGLPPRATTMVVVDDETGALALSTPTSAAEGASTALTGTVSVNPAASGVVTVNLATSSTNRLTVPSSVTILPGQTSATFPIAVVDNSLLDGAQNVTITASVAGWTSATAATVVTDNESRNLSLSGPYSLVEGGTGSGTIYISGTMTVPLVVNLSSANPAQLTVPASVTIPAGSTSVSFTATGVNDTLFDGTQSVAITASAATLNNATTTTTVADNDVHHFAFSPISTLQTVSQSFSVTVYAQDVNNVNLSSYTGTAALSAAAGGSPVTMTPAVTGAFSSGRWTGSVAVTETALGAGIIATGGGASGTSGLFDTLVGASIIVTPPSITLALLPGATYMGGLAISNSGNQTLTWQIASAGSLSVSSIEAGPQFAGLGAVVPALLPDGGKAGDKLQPDAPIHQVPRTGTAEAITAGQPALSAVLNNLNVNHGLIRGAIPGRYAFTEGVTGSSIGDGGNDMYDGGNSLGTNISAGYLNYSDNVFASSPLLGAGGQYFTRKFDGLFVFAADVSGLSYFEITGNLGADGGGATDTAVLTTVHDGTTYRGFVKRVYNAGDPSVNHLIIVPDNGSVTHEASTDTNNDYHRVTGLAGVTRIYHLLYAGTSGAYINNVSTQAIMTAFLDAVAAPDWVAPSPLSGSVAPGASQNVSLAFDATGLATGVYNRSLIITSNDFSRPSVAVPIQLTIVAPPAVVTGGLTGLTATGATFNGTVNPGGQPTTAQFEYGPTTTYGSTVTVSLAPNDGSASQAVSATVAGLPPGLLHYRLVAVNSLGVANGLDRTVTMGSPAITVERGGLVLADGATVDFGSVPIGALGATHAFTVRNAGSVPLTGLAVTTDGLGAGDFSVPAAGLPATLAAGETASLSVTFRPWQGGVRAAGLRLASNDPVLNPFNLALTGTSTVVAGPGQSIVFGPVPAAVATTAAPFTVRAAATSGLPVTYSVVTGPVTVAASGLVTLTGGPGVVRLRVSQAGGGGYDAAEGFVSFQVTPVGQNFVKVARAPFASFGAGIRGDGTLWAWGSNANGQLGDGTTTSRGAPVQVGAATNWATVACGNAHTMAIKTDGSLWAWGLNSAGQLGDGSFVQRLTPVRVGTGTNWAAVACGYAHSLAVKTDGTLWACGWNGFGELGDGTTINRSAPVQIGTATNWATVAGGDDHSAAVTVDGTLWTWGRNDNSELGDGTIIQRLAPVQIGVATNWTAVTCGFAHTAAVRGDGSLWAWGLNTGGQLGDGTINTRSAPVAIGAGALWAGVAAGQSHTLGLRSDGTLWAWGSNQSDQLGNGPATLRTSPAQIGTRTNWAAATASYAHSVGIATDGTLSAWGSNASGQLGDGGNTRRPAPVLVNASGPWLAFAEGNTHSAGVRSDGTLWAWGLNANGQLGDGTTSDRSVPVQVGADADWRGVACGAAFTLAVKSNGTLWAWGLNTTGQLGDGSTTQRLSPVQIGLNADWATVAAGDRSSAGIKTGGTLWTWGSNDSGQSGAGSISIRLTPAQVGIFTWLAVTCGEKHLEAIRTDGTLWATGNNLYGQLGDGANAQRTALAQIGTATDWQTVSAGFSHTVAMKADGTLWAWGRNQSGQLGDGLTANRNAPVQIGTATSWTGIAAGEAHTMGIRSDGTLWAWGSNGGAQLGDGTTADRSTPGQVGTGNGWTKLPLRLGSTNSTIQSLDGTLWAWGSGTLGTGDYRVPAQILPTRAAQGFVFPVPSALLVGVPVVLGAVGDSQLPVTYRVSGPATLVGNVITRTAQGFLQVVAWQPGDVAWASTEPLAVASPLATTGLATGVDSNGATVGGTVNPNGQVTTAQFEYGVTTAYGSTASVTLSPNNGNTVQTVSAALTGLTAGATYNYRLTATNGMGSGSGVNRTFATPGPSLVVEQPAGTPLGNGVGTRDFGSATIGAAGSTLSFTLRNTGTGTLTGLALSLEGAGRLDYTINATGLPTVLAPGASTGLSVSFRPYQGAERAATLRLVSNDVARSPFIVNLTGTGLTQPGPTQTIVVAPPTLVRTGSAPFYLRAGATSGLPVTATLLTGPATLDLDGLITLTGVPGAVTLRFTQPGGSGYDPAETYVTFPVTVAGKEFVKVARGSGASHAAGLRADGTLWTWGLNTSGQLGDGTTTTRPAPVQVATPVLAGGPWTWADVACGASHTVAVLTNGTSRTLWAWGQNSSGQLGDSTTTQRLTPVQIGTATNWGSVAGGSGHTVALQTTGTLWTWGLNNSSQLGDGTIANRSAPAQVGTALWASVACGSSYTLGVQINGTLWAWGLNSNGQLGDGTTTTRTTPGQIGSALWTTVAGGTSHTLAVKSDGTLWSWGLNTNGQLGDGSTTQRTAPAQIGTAGNWVALTAGANHSLGGQSDGTLWSWGLNTSGQLGDASITARTAPVRIGTASNWASVVAGSSHTVALQSDGTLWTWGLNTSGQSADSATTQRLRPVPAGSWAAVANGTSFTVAVKADGTLWAWGSNTSGQLGDGTTIHRSAPVQIGVANDWASVAAGSNHTVALKTDGTLWSWGNNASGQLGDGTVISRTSPAQAGTDLWASVACGTSYTLGLKTDGSLWAWGTNGRGQLGNNSTTQSNLPVAIAAGTQWTTIVCGASHTVGRQLDGSLWAWGNNGNGQLGDGSILQRNVPVPIAAGTAWTAVTCGASHTLAVKSDGTLWAWGLNTSGQLGNGTTAQSLSPSPIGLDTAWSALAGGLSHSAALKTDGTLWTWGINTSGQLGNGTPTQSLSPTLATTGSAWWKLPARTGDTFTTVLARDGTAWTAGDRSFGVLGQLDPSMPTRAWPARAAQTLSLPTLPTLTVGVPVTLAAAAGSQLPISYRVVGPGTLSGNLLTPTAPGPLQLIAWQPGDTTWATTDPARQSQTVVAASALATWRQTHFGSATADTGDSQDFNHNGISNVLEFAFGTNPVTSTPGALQYNGTFAGGGAIGRTGQPVVLSENTGMGIEYRAVWVRRLDHVAAGLTYVPYFSHDLQTWTRSAVAPTELANDGIHQIVSVPFPAFLNGRPTQTFKVEVTLTP